MAAHGLSHQQQQVPATAVRHLPLSGSCNSSHKSYQLLLLLVVVVLLLLRLP
jgi:hypothetical protein